ERMATAVEGAEIRVAHPDEALLFVLAPLCLELLVKARHHAGEVRAPIAIAADLPLPLVRAPELLGRVREERVHVRSHLEVRRRPADLEHAAALLLERAIRRHPDHLDEEMLAEDVAEDALALGDAPARLAEVAEAVAARGPLIGGVEVVLQHQALRR